MIIRVSQAFPINVKAENDAGSLYIRAYITELDGDAVTTVDLTHQTGGWYFGSYTYAGTEKQLNCRTAGFTDAGYSVADTTRVYPVEDIYIDDSLPTGADSDTGETLSDQLDEINNNVTNIVTTGAPSYQEPASYTLTTGTQTSGTYESVVSPNSVYHVHTSVGNALSFYYEYTLRSDEIASGFILKGRINSSNDSVYIQAYDWVNSQWVTQYTLVGVNTTTDTTRTEPLVSRFTGTGLNIGKVRINIVNAVVLSSATIYIDQLIISKTDTSRTVGYSDGAVWVKATGNSGTENYTNGTADNPCPWADALVIAASLGLSRFRIVNGESVTLTAACESKTLIGKNWDLALNGQSITNSFFEGARVSGTATASGNAPIFEYCGIGAVTLPPIRLYQCGIGRESGTFTGGSAGTYNFIDCFSLVGSGGTPTLTFAGIGSATYILMRRWAAGSNLTIDSNCSAKIDSLGGGIHTVTVGGGTLSIRGTSKGVTLTSVAGSTSDINGVFGAITINGTGGAVTINGVTNEYTDNSGGTVTITDNAVHQATDFATGTDISNLQTHGDTDWATATGFAVPGDEMDLIDAPNSTAITAIQNGLAVETGGNIADIKTVTDKLGTMVEADGANYKFTEDALQEVSVDLTTLEADVKRLLGLEHENCTFDNPTFDSDNNTLTARFRTYTDAASVGTTSNVLATYNMTATFSAAGKFTKVNIVKA